LAVLADVDEDTFAGAVLLVGALIREPARCID
jgi:hypothetical protein